jgi:membrane-associated protease RseP (regulator of RpoE activity)
MAFDAHPPDPEGKREFEHFLSVQLLWDEGMAERVAQYFKDNPGGHMVVLAGAGHVVYGQGIPGRVQRRVPVSSAIVVNGTEPGMSADLADYVVLTQPHELPAAGKLGVLLDTGEDGVRVQGFADESPAKAVGLEEGDRIIALDGESVKTYTDVRLIMFDRTPGEQVRVRVARGEGETDTVDYLVTLH